MTTLRAAFGALGIQSGTDDAPDYRTIVDCLRSEYLGATGSMSTHAIASSAHGQRRAKSAARLALYRDDFASEVQALIDRLYTHKDVKVDRERLTDMIGFLNVPKRITDEVASLYDIPAKRRFPDQPAPLPVDGVAPLAQPNPRADEFHAVEREVDLHSVMKEAHRLTFWLNNVLLWSYAPPGARRQLRILTPDRFDVVSNPLDALDLVAVIVDVVPTWTPAMVVNVSLLPHYEVWDAEVKIVIDGTGRILSSDPHGQGRIPGVLMSSRLPVDRLLEDRAGEDIYAAARAVLFLNLCTLSLSRDASEQQPWLKGNLATMAANQPQTSGRPLALPPGVEIGSLNLVTDPEHLLKVIRAVIASVAQSYGMSYEQFTFQETADTASGKAYTVRRQKLTEMRTAQRQRAVVHERDVMDLLGFPDAQAPDFHEQEVPTDPLEEMDLFDRRCNRGLDNPIAWLMRKDTDLSAEDAASRFSTNVAVTGALFHLLRVKNLSLTAGADEPGKDAAGNGADGPAAHDPEDAESDDDVSWVKEMADA